MSLNLLLVLHVLYLVSGFSVRASTPLYKKTRVCSSYLSGVKMSKIEVLLLLRVFGQSVFGLKRSTSGLPFQVECYPSIKAVSKLNLCCSYLPMRVTKDQMLLALFHFLRLLSSLKYCGAKKSKWSYHQNPPLNLIVFAIFFPLLSPRICH